MTLLQRRLRAEWQLLQAMVQQNPDRLREPRADDLTFFVTMLFADPTNAKGVPVSHDVRVVYPIHFPGAPMEVYLNAPVLHPNVHPVTAFVCVWERHRVSNTIEIALHRVDAMLSGRLYNATPLHVMQPEALVRMTSSAGTALQEQAPLQGVPYTSSYLPPTVGSRAALAGKSRLS